MGFGAVDGSLAGIEKATHGRMALVVGDLFTHPTPEIFNRIGSVDISGRSFKIVTD